MDSKANFYQCSLSKQALAYNIIYHLSKMEDGDNPYTIVEDILDKFESEEKDS